MNISIFASPCVFIVRSKPFPAFLFTYTYLLVKYLKSCLNKTTIGNICKTIKTQTHTDSCFLFDPLAQGGILWLNKSIQSIH